jgi:glycosyltransferase involved in cell wall biosynthesis
MRAAFITDWLEKYGGAERVVTAINEIQKFDYYYAYINKMDMTKQKYTLGGREVVVVQSNILSIFKKRFRLLTPFFPLIVKSFNIQTKKNSIDLVVSSSWALSKSYRVGDEIHICYLQARNFKYVWEESALYFKGPIKLFSFLKPYLQKFDKSGAMNPDFLIANSHFVKEWVKEKYNREATVIYPPVDVDDFFISELKEDYFITVGRLEPYKRFDVLVEAFNENGKKLFVIGDGSELKKLQKKANENITFLGFKTKDDIKALLSKSLAFVYSGVEDFGIALVEALASGVPVIAYKGGAAEEIVNQDNGILFNHQSPLSVNQAIDEFSSKINSYNPTIIRYTSLKFSKERFQQEYKNYVEEVVLEHHNKLALISSFT